jgi:hypothetical protein
VTPLQIARNISTAAVASIAAWSSWSHMVHVALRYGDRIVTAERARRAALANTPEPQRAEHGLAAFGTCCVTTRAAFL